MPEEQVIPEKIEPVEEHYSGNNAPYRGTQNHGVPLPKYSYDTYVEENDFDDEEAKNIAYLSEMKAAPPMPVSIINSIDRDQYEIRRFRTYRMYVKNIPVQIAGKNPNRIKIVIQNANAGDTVWIGDSLSVGTSTGFPLGGTKLEMVTTEEVFAFRNSDVAMYYDIIEEYAVRLHDENI